MKIPPAIFLAFARENANKEVIIKTKRDGDLVGVLIGYDPLTSNFLVMPPGIKCITCEEHYEEDCGAYVFIEGWRQFDDGIMAYYYDEIFAAPSKNEIETLIKALEL